MATALPTFAVQRSAERFFADHGWLRTYHSFSFAEYHDPANTNWGALRVLNDDTIGPGAGFPTHPHEDMEIVTYVLDGRLEHRDSIGNHGVVGPGGIQFMSAGTGVRHSEFNHSKDAPCRLVQMWVLPGQRGLPPSYGQVDFTIEDRRGKFLDAVGPRGSGLPVELTQDARFAVARMEGGTLVRSFAPGRLGFLFVADGEIVANDVRLSGGDAVRMAGVEALHLSGQGEVLLWDVVNIK